MILKLYQLQTSSQLVETVSQLAFLLPDIHLYMADLIISGASTYLHGNRAPLFEDDAFPAYHHV